MIVSEERRSAEEYVVLPTPALSGVDYSVVASWNVRLVWTCCFLSLIMTKSDLNFRDDQFDLSDATFSMTLAVLAITALTGTRQLLALAWLFACFGLIMEVAGLLGHPLHPAALVKLLS